MPYPSDSPISRNGYEVALEGAIDDVLTLADNWENMAEMIVTDLADPGNLVAHAFRACAAQVRAAILPRCDPTAWQSTREFRSDGRWHEIDQMNPEA